MIKSIRHKALRAYAETGQAKGLNPSWLKKLRRVLVLLDQAGEPEDMNYPGAYFHALKGQETGRYSVRLTANYRVTFGWSDEGATDIDIEDYH